MLACHDVNRMLMNTNEEIETKEKAAEKRLFTSAEVVIIVIICLGLFAAVWQIAAWIHS